MGWRSSPMPKEKYVPYIELLRDPRWQKKRLQVMERDGFECTNCGDTKTTLNVHHLRYTGKPWEAHLADLTTLCEVCHKRTTDLVRRAKDVVGALTEPALWRVIGYVQVLTIQRRDGATISLSNHDHMQGVADALRLPIGVLVDEVINGRKEVSGEELVQLVHKDRSGR